MLINGWIFFVFSKEEYIPNVMDSVWLIKKRSLNLKCRHSSFDPKTEKIGNEAPIAYYFQGLLLSYGCKISLKT